jgi:hypothetical protein
MGGISGALYECPTPSRSEELRMPDVTVLKVGTQRVSPVISSINKKECAVEKVHTLYSRNNSSTHIIIVVVVNILSVCVREANVYARSTRHTRGVVMMKLQWSGRHQTHEARHKCTVTLCTCHTRHTCYSVGYAQTNCMGRRTLNWHTVYKCSRLTMHTRVNTADTFLLALDLTLNVCVHTKLLHAHLCSTDCPSSWGHTEW